MRQMLCPAVVGRDEEITLLREALSAASEGAGQTICITGEAGIGKSRLAVELERFARAEGMRILRGRAVPTTSSIPFRPFAEALYSTFRSGAAPYRSMLGPYGSALGLLVPEWADENRLSYTHESPVFLQEGAVRLLRILAAGTGALLVLEDLHWADPESLGLVEYFADHLTSERLLCVCTVRSDEESEALTLFRTLRGRQGVLTVPLGRLSTADMMSLARACLDASDPGNGVMELLTARAEGIPFLAEEILASCLAVGTLVRDREGWRLRDGSGHPVPDNIRGLVRQRLQRLDETPQAVVRGAAVLGRQFDWTFLPGVLRLSRKEVLSCLRLAVNAQLITTETTGEHEQFRFRHAITREALLEELLPPELVDMARRLAEAVERAHPGLPADWCERAATLWELAGEHSRAAQLLWDSGRRALRRTALASAENVLERARRAAQGHDELVRGVDEDLVVVLHQAGKTGAAVEVGERLVASLRDDAAPPGRQGAAALALGRAYAASGEWEIARWRLMDAERLAGAASDGELHARIRSSQSQMELSVGRHAQASRFAREALEAAERLAIPEVACEALDVLGRQAQSSDFVVALAMFAEARRIAVDNGLILWQIRSLLEMGTVEELMGGSLESLLQVRTIAAESGALSTLASIEQNVCWAYLFSARVDELTNANRTCVDLCRRFGLSLLPHALVVSAAIHTLRGQRRQAEAAIEEALCTEDVDVSAGAWGWRGTIALLAEDRVGAVLAFDCAMGPLRGTGQWMNWYFIGARALLLEILDRDGGTAREELRGSPMALACWSEAALCYADAVAHGRAGNGSAAADAVARADDLLGWAPFLHHVYRRLVAEAAIRDGWGDPAMWLRESLGFFESLGLRSAAGACRGLLRKAGAPAMRRRRRPAGVPAALESLGVTERESDVLRLVVEGLPSPEIGRRLFLSPRTVESHVTSLLRRTGSRNRAQLISMTHRLLDAGSQPPDLALPYTGASKPPRRFP